MIDIIIPAFNAHDTIFQSLSSIAIQTIRDKCKVYIVDDCSIKNYNKEVKGFKGILDIYQLRTEKNRGAGYARQFGIDNSSSEYIVFLDSDDLFHDCFALKRLFDAIEESGCDLVAGAFINEGKTNAETFIARDSAVFGCLHGKIYRRKYLEDNKIRFNYTRYSEDNSFGGIVANTSDKIKVISDVVYVYKYNKNSITSDNKKLVRIHTSYLHNMLWLAKELEKRGVDQSSINNVMLNSYVYIYHEIFEHRDVDFSDLFYQCFMFEEYFKKISKFISIDDIVSYLNVHFHGDDFYIRLLLDGFLKFREKFKKKGDCK